MVFWSTVGILLLFGGLLIVFIFFCFFSSSEEHPVFGAIATILFLISGIINICVPMKTNRKISDALPKEDYVDTCQVEAAELAMNVDSTAQQDLAKYLVEQGDAVDYCRVVKREASYYYIEVVTLEGDKETFAFDKYELCDILEYIHFDNTLNVE